MRWDDARRKLYDLCQGANRESIGILGANTPWPLPNVQLGVSVENQATADRRIPLLLQCPAAVRFVSYEPALESIRLTPDTLDHIDGVIAGGESGPGARPAHPDWFRSARDQCKAAGVPFFFKQWGAWGEGLVPIKSHRWQWGAWRNGSCDEMPFSVAGSVASKGGLVMTRVGKRPAGRLLDGREHNALPGGG